MRTCSCSTGASTRAATPCQASRSARTYFRAELDRTELARVFERGELASSVTFVGNDGVTYKTGYAPVHLSETEPEIVLALGAQAPASYFSRLADLRRRLLRWGAGLAAVSVCGRGARDAADHAQHPAPRGGGRADRCAASCASRSRSRRATSSACSPRPWSACASSSPSATRACSRCSPASRTRCATRSPA